MPDIVGTINVANFGCLSICANDATALSCKSSLTIHSTSFGEPMKINANNSPK
jgi:hypothetical protein